MSSPDPIESTYAAVVRRVPERARTLARRLPYELGLTPDPHGGWLDYVRRPATRDLPAFAAEGAEENGARISEERLDRFRAAHHCGGFFCLLIDRVADGQAKGSPELPTLRRILREAWSAALTRALGDAEAAAAAIARALRAWARGIRAQRSLANGARITPSAYLTMCRDRFYWAGTAAFCLLEQAAPVEAQRIFSAAWDRYMLAMQCLDDARDASEDERLLGTSIPQALGFPPGTLHRAATHFMREAAQLAAAGGHRSLSRSSQSLFASLEAIVPGGDPLENELTALILVESARQESALPQ